MAGKAGRAWCNQVGLGAARRGWARQARRGLVGKRGARRGLVWQARHGLPRLGKAWHGKAGHGRNPRKKGNIWGTINGEETKRGGST